MASNLVEFRQGLGSSTGLGSLICEYFLARVVRLIAHSSLQPSLPAGITTENHDSGTDFEDVSKVLPRSATTPIEHALQIIQNSAHDNGPRPRLVIWAHDTDICDLAYLPDGRRIVTASDDGTVEVWNLESGEQEGTSMEHEHAMVNVTVTRDGTKIICSDYDGNIKVWDVESHELVEEWTHPGRCTKIAISPDDRLIAVGAWTVAIYTMEGRQANHSIESSFEVACMCFSPDGTKLACGTDNIRVYDVDNGTLIFKLECYQNRVLDVLWSCDGSRLFSGWNDKTIRCWNYDTREQIGHPWTGHTDSIRTLSLSPDGSILASASWDKTVRFWDTTTGNPIRQHLQHDDEVEAVRFSPSGEFVTSAGGDGKIYVWRVPLLDPIVRRVITLFIVCVLALVLTVLQAMPTLPGIEHILRGFHPLYASIFSIEPSV